MVACDLCDMWYHYKCVHVGDSVADRSWTCPGCNKELLATSTPVGRPKKTSSSRRSSITVSTTASARAARAALELQQLEERKRLDMKRVLEEEERRKQEAELEKARIEQEKLQREKEAELERRRLDEERRQQDQERMQREKEAELERKRLENDRRQQEQEQALAKKKLDDEKSRSDLLRKLEEKYLAEKYRILNAQLEGSAGKGSVISSISFSQSSDGAKALPDKQQRRREDRREKDRAQNAENTERERLYQMRLEEEKRREDSRKKLEQMGFAEKSKTLYGPRNQRAEEWVESLENQISNPLKVLPVPLPMGKSGRERYTGTKPKASRDATQENVPDRTLAGREQHPDIWEYGPGVSNRPEWRQPDLPRNVPLRPTALPRIPEENHPGLNLGSNAPRGGTRADQVQASAQHSRGASGLTNSQLAARQVLSKDLPSFFGNPEDWPVFISNYENSTAECGYTNTENLIRLHCP